MELSLSVVVKALALDGINAAGVGGVVLTLFGGEDTPNLRMRKIQLETIKKLALATK
ncbi:MAG: hypothetical protein NC548_39910 [Lachnospiraceae bacterium]|nr:hypothetical protein [Lachnospiraceae bacterium]